MFAMFRNNLPQNSAKTDFLNGVGKSDHTEKLWDFHIKHKF